mmetsp:Transcript_78879/g.221142  ORF Transcript_78879/g.221142 Transcript_78879/m.221142 type:complete len:109 (+) Transcript_78879:3-329(+)
MGGCGMMAGGMQMRGGMRLGDWMCPSCGDHQFAKNESCRRCQTARPAGGAAVCGMKEGDWFCPNCKDLQYARNDACRMCSTPRPADAGAAAGLMGGVRERSRSPLRSG